MTQPLLSRQDLEFLLYEWCAVDDLTARPRYAEHGRETFDAALEMSEAVAREHFAPHHALNGPGGPAAGG
ncbi:acyl-CoA dehydrogenase N-terminal domain-containing protein [Actinomadura geliboluensis]|uniref:acyl-CoA dehydrogenase N-terminal domain-containing protein n=1 Tax=Actinomadura geliboluensis TaxID=882440 RepID=UPI00371CD5DD